MSEAERKQYEEAAKANGYEDGLSDESQDRFNAFMDGCEHAHSKIEEAEREAHNKAIRDALTIIRINYGDGVIKAIEQLKMMIK